MMKTIRSNLSQAQAVIEKEVKAKRARKVTEKNYLCMSNKSKK